MKIIENKTITIKVETISSEGKLQMVDVIQTYAQLIFTACKRPGRTDQGYSYDELKSIGRIDEITCGGNTTIVSLELEDMDFTFVKDRVITMSWNVYDKELISFVDYIKDIN
jgi:hypothetical protein